MPVIHATNYQTAYNMRPRLFEAGPGVVCNRRGDGGGSTEGGGGGNEPETDALIAAMSPAPDAARIELINDLIVSLKTDGIWDKLDVLWVMAAHDAQAARLNWKAPASFALTAVNSPTFTTDRGYAGNGTTSYLNTGWVPSTDGVNLTQNNAGIGLWSRDVGQVAAIDVGSRTAGSANQTALAARTGANQSLSRINIASTSAADFANLDGSGLIVTQRVSAAFLNGYRNAASIGSAGVSSVSPSTFEIYVCGLNTAGVAGSSSRQLAMARLGAGLTAGELTDEYNAMQTYMTAVGAA